MDQWSKMQSRLHWTMCAVAPPHPWYDGHRAPMRARVNGFHNHWIFFSTSRPTTRLN